MRQDLYTEIYKILLKEINENKWKHIPCSWIGRFNVKMPRLAKTVYKFKVILVKIPLAVFAGVEKNLKIHIKFPMTPNMQNSLKKKKTKQSYQVLTSNHIS